jgi:hypothetical protein
MASGELHAPGTLYPEKETSVSFDIVQIVLQSWSGSGDEEKFP